MGGFTHTPRAKTPQRQPPRSPRSALPTATPSAPAAATAPVAKFAGDPLGRLLARAVQRRGDGRTGRDGSRTGAPVTRDSSIAMLSRLITVGDLPVRRSHETPPELERDLTLEGVRAKYQQLNDDRTRIYKFVDYKHLIGHLTEREGFADPIIELIPDDQQAQYDIAHQRASDERFANLFAPAQHQIPTHGPGAHNIPREMLPPAGEKHRWTQSPDHTGTPRYGIYVNRLDPPAAQTLPLTYGDPRRPSLGMNQGGMNLGMYIVPTSKAKKITRNKTTYAKLRSVPGRVRGHPFALEQTQEQTGALPGTPGRVMSFDTDARMYTDESDATKKTGGVSTYRYSEVEAPSIRSGQPFLQVNVNPTIGPMGVARPDEIFFRLSTAAGYDDRRIDNTAKTDYREAARQRPNKKIRAHKYQTSLGQAEAAKRPYESPPVHTPGTEFTSADARSQTGNTAYPGSPPPSPFLTLFDEEVEVVDPSPDVLPWTNFDLPGGNTGYVVGPSTAQQQQPTAHYTYKVRKRLRPAPPPQLNTNGRILDDDELNRPRKKRRTQQGEPPAATEATNKT